MTMWTPTLDPAAPIYRSVVDALARDIASGRLTPGERLPTQRELASALGVSIGTVTRAYALAERRGLARGEVGRGSFVGSPEHHTLPVGELGETVDGAVNLSMTWPIADGDPDLGAALRRLGREPDVGELLRYGPNAGRDRHRAAGARWMRRFGLEVPPERVVVCSGTQHAMLLAMGSTLRAGDTLLCEGTTYPGIRAAAEFLGVDVHGLEVDDGGLVPDALEAACRERRGQALYVVPTLHNPTTATLSTERRRAIAEIATRHGLPVFEDAIHHLLLDDAPPTIASLAPEVTTLLAAPSKVIAGGLRIGFLAAAAGTVERLTQAAWATTWMVSPLSAEIFARWIDDGTADRAVAAKRAEAAARVELARGALAALDVSVPDVSYHAWMRLPAGEEPAAAFAERAKSAGVLVAPAEAFHVGPGPAPRAVRLSLSAPGTREALGVGLGRLVRAAAGDRAAARPVL